MSDFTNMNMEPGAVPKRRICRKCLVPDFIEDKDRFLANALRSISEDDRTEDVLYEFRLEKCESCKKYANGLCRLCGCFVAVRAAVKAQYCPGNPKLW